MIHTVIQEPFGFTYGESRFSNGQKGHHVTVRELCLDPECESGVSADTQLEGCVRWNCIDFRLIFGPQHLHKIKGMLGEGKHAEAFNWLLRHVQAREVGVL
jgi:hypothetical protein